MNPNKKILNPKNSQSQGSPWLLCPSKSFPGKFYYFNGSTGETAWCLSETDKNLKKGPIHRVTDKSHTYPEPFDPPVDNSTNTTNSFSFLKNTGRDFTYNAKVRPSPVFGQAVFPKYVSPDIFTPKYVWTLTPMYVTTQMPPQGQMLNQITQPCESEQPMFVQTSHFPPFKKPTFTPEFNSSPFQFKDKPIFEASKFNFKSSIEPTMAKPQMKDEACQTFVPIRPRLRTHLESESALKSGRSVENLTLLKDVETSTQSPSNKIENGNDRLFELDKNDLRFKLVATKKKVECTAVGGTAEKSTDQSKAAREGVLKKRVTFNVEEPWVSHVSSEDVQAADQSPDSSGVEGPHWYVVTDTEILLSEMQCIEEFVKSDANCRLLIPHAVYSEIESRSRGDCSALAARSLLRRLTASNNHVIVQSNPETELPPEDSILECCWSLLQEDCHVVLISNNKNMLNKAKSINLECYTAEEIKMGDETDPVPQYDLTKLKIIVDNDQNKSIIVENYRKKSENLFMQNLKGINGLSLTKPNGFNIRQSRINIFDTETDKDNVLNKTDTNSDKLINLTKPKNNVKSLFNPEMTRVKNQIVKLNTGDSPTQNRTKQIIKNVFSTKGIINKKDQDTAIGLEKYNYKQNIKNKLDNINQNQKCVLKNVEIIDGNDLDIRKLNIIDNNQEKSSDTTQISGITKLNKQFDLKEELERFYIKNSVMDARLKSKFDEWVCRLTQTMEGALTDILFNEKAKFKRITPPWNLFEAIQVTGETFKKQPNIKTIIGQFSIKLLNCSSHNGGLKNDIKPHDFIKLIGFSVILIEHLKEILNCKELYEAEERLSDLIMNIEDPKTDKDLTLEKVNTPIFSRSDTSDSQVPIGFRKNRSEILEYLKKHFAAWQTETDATVDNIENERNVLVTCGRNLNTLKINNTKTITVENDKNTEVTNEKPIGNDKVNVNQPKVIRNVKIIDAFEERIKNRANLDLDDLDYENKSVYSGSVCTEIKSEIPDEYDGMLNDLSVSSSADTECIRAFPLAKIFLVKVKNTLIRIFNFIKASLHAYQEGITMNKKADIKLKTELTQHYLMKIAERLKNIIARESGEGMTLKHLLIKAGDYEDDDRVMANYKQTVTKYLHKAQLLEEILEHMMSLTNAASPKESDGSHCTSFNTPSPILPTRLRSLKRSTGGHDFTATNRRDLS